MATMKMKIITMNVQGQSKMKKAKQLYINDLLKNHDADVVMFQEIDIEDETFNECNFIKNNDNIIKINYSDHWFFFCICLVCFFSNNL